MKPKRLHWLVFALLALAALVMRDSALPAALTVPDHSSNEQASGLPPGAPDVQRRIIKERSRLPAPVRDPFARPHMLPDAPPAASTPGMPTPAAPRHLHYRVIGKQYEETAGWTVFLAQGEQTWVVRSGELLGNEYQVAAINPPRLTLRHLQSKVHRSLDIGEAKE